MRKSFRMLLALVITLGGFVMLYWLTNFGNTANISSLYVFIAGFFMVFVGLGLFLYKPQVRFDIPAEGGLSAPMSEERAARERKESGTLVAMTVPLNNEYYHAPMGDGLPAKPLEWWK